VCYHLPRLGPFVPGEITSDSHSSLGGFQRQSGRCREKKNLLLLPGIEIWFLDDRARALRFTPTDLTRSEYAAKVRRNNLPKIKCGLVGAGQTQNQNVFLLLNIQYVISVIQFLYGRVVILWSRLSSFTSKNFPLTSGCHNISRFIYSTLYHIEPYQLSVFEWHPIRISDGTLANLIDVTEILLTLCWPGY
jgi:hypothetical protein